MRFCLDFDLELGGDTTKKDVGNCGHSIFYFMRDLAVVGGKVPLYTDVRPIVEEMLGGSR